jgi:hypothetical protein
MTTSGRGTGGAGFEITGRTGESLHLEPDPAAGKERRVGEPVEEVFDLHRPSGDERQSCMIGHARARIPGGAESDAEVPVVDLAARHQSQPGQKVETTVDVGRRLREFGPEQGLPSPAQRGALPGEPVVALRPHEAARIVVQHHDEGTFEGRLERARVRPVDSLTMRHRLAHPRREESPLAHLEQLHAQVRRAGLERGIHAAVTRVAVEFAPDEAQQPFGIRPLRHDRHAGRRRGLRPGDGRGGQRQHESDGGPPARAACGVHQNTMPICSVAPGAYVSMPPASFSVSMT